jgi:membrane protein required for colicin V production
VALVLILGAFAAKGAWRGFFREACGLGALISGLAASFALGQNLGRILANQWDLAPPVAGTVAHALLFLGPYVTLQAVGFGLHRLGRALFLGTLDRVAGLALGVAAGTVLAGGGLALLAQTARGAAWLEGSVLAAPITAAFLGAARWAAGFVG